MIDEHDLPIDKHTSLSNKFFRFSIKVSLKNPKIYFNHIQRFTIHSV